MKLKPTLDRVVIKREKIDTVSKGGILLPHQAKKESNYGKVVAVGPGGFNVDGSRRPMSVKKGDRVIFTSEFYMTTTENNLVIVDDEAILAVAEG